MYANIIIRPRAFAHISVEFGVRAEPHPPGTEHLNDFATVCISTGACHVQAYLLPSDLRAVARAMLDAAVAIDERQQVTA